jgi:thioredoxin reductase
MRPATARVRDDWVIVGGGIHGTYFARELLEAGVPHDAITILDSQGTLLGSFRRYARACGMAALRSPHVQHLASEPFDMMEYATRHGRTDQLLAIPDELDRPTLPLFLDHSRRVIERFALDTLVADATVTGVDRDRDGLLVRTEASGTYPAANVLVSIGYGGRYNYPAGAQSTDRLTHVWEHDRSPAAVVDEGGDCWVIGGGVTAGQVALSAAKTAGSVTLCTPHPLRTALTIADPDWLNWQHIERRLHSLQPGSADRYELISEVRKDGTMPEHLKYALEHHERIRVKRGRVTNVRETSSGLELTRHDGKRVGPDRVILATGFANPGEHPFVRHLASTLGLETDVHGLPVLDDETLAWQRRDGYQSSVFVSGTLSATAVGPFAGTIPGARRAAERILGRTAVFA